MEYRRSVLLGIRFFRKLIALSFLFYLIAAFFEIGPGWLRGRHEPSWLLALGGLEIFLSFVERQLRDEPLSAPSDPSPATSGTTVVILTGVAAAAATGWHASGLTDLVVPTGVLVSTAILALLVYRFTRRNAGQIGEARFKTPPGLK